MGNSVCCCCCDEDCPQEQQHQRQRGGAGFRQQRPAAFTPIHTTCRICGQTNLDPALIDGHEESCRAAMRRNMLHRDSDTIPLRSAQQHNYGAETHHSNNDNTSAAATATTTTSIGKTKITTQDEETDDPDKACTICLTNKKKVACVPCGHVVFCIDCSSRGLSSMSTCPLCRQPREGLLIINEAIPTRCKFCSHVIAPIYFDSHQEVCRLRTRLLAKELLENDSKREFSSSNNNSNNNGTSEVKRQEEEKDLCVVCFKEKKEIALLPCTHLIGKNCSDCKECPLCYTRITSRIKLFD